MKKLTQVLILLTSLWATTTVPAFAEIAVIINGSNSAAVNQSDIKRIFLGKKKSYSNGSPVLPVNLSPSNPLRQQFDKSALGKSASQIKAYWSKLVFSGKGAPPKEFATDAEILKLVKENPAVIGYIDASKADASVKVVAKF